MDFINSLLPEVFKTLPIWGKWISFIWLLFVFILFYSLKHNGKGRERLLKHIHERTYQIYYRRQIGRLLEYTLTHFFKDFDAIRDYRRTRISGNNSGFNLFNTLTELSYVFLLKIAIFIRFFFCIELACKFTGWRCWSSKCSHG